MKADPVLPVGIPSLFPAIYRIHKRIPESVVISRGERYNNIMSALCPFWTGACMSDAGRARRKARGEGKTGFEGGF